MGAALNFLEELEAMPVPALREGPHLEHVKPGTRPHPGNPLGNVWGRKAPTSSAELQRVLSLPRRPVESVDLEAITELMTRALRKPDGPCQCAALGRKCILRLKPIQAWALYEISLVGGLLGPIGVGAGKTGLDILAPVAMPFRCNTTVLLVPPVLADQVVNEYKLWAQHWKVPRLISGNECYGWKKDEDNITIHLVKYSRLSRHEATALLLALLPDLIIADEAHRLKNVDTARGARFMNLYKQRKETRLCAWSGSLTDKSIKDYAHLAGLALAGGSPLPLDQETILEWANAIDPPKYGQEPNPMGALESLCGVGETLHHGYRRRLLETVGVVATDDAGIGASLYMHERDPGDIPDNVREAILTARRDFVRPDGEELVDSFTVTRCCRELAAGFFYYWEFPRGEPRELIDRWFLARRNWAREVRDKLRFREEHLDSPLLLAKAAIRFYSDESYDGPLPVWESQTWREWRDVRGLVKPESRAEWIDDYLARDAAEWGLKNRGIIWYHHRTFGAKVAEISGLPQHAGGPDAGERIAAERGDRTIIASINSHGEGRDGLQRLFDQQLVANPPESKATGGAAKWEQLLGRLHREGQEADEIHTHLYRHTSEMRDAWDRARQLARYVTDTMGSYQKLLSCTATWE